MARRLRNLLRLAGTACVSPHVGARDLQQAWTLLLDLEFDHSSPLPVLPQRLLRTLGATEFTLLPSDFQIIGTQDPEGLRFLVGLAKVLRMRSVFEIGTFTGVTALTLALNARELTIHTLDLPIASSPLLQVENEDKRLMPAKPRQRVFENRPEAERIIQHWGDSAEFDFIALGLKFDLVYIDGAHSYEYVENDTRMAFSIVADTGVVVWDDYQRDWPGVVRYLNGTALRLFRVPGTRLVIWLSDPAKSIIEGIDPPLTR